MEIVPKYGDWNFDHVLLPKIRGSTSRIQSDQKLRDFYNGFKAARFCAMCLKAFFNDCNHGYKLPSCVLEHLMRHLAGVKKFDSERDPHGVLLFQAVMRRIAAYSDASDNEGIRQILQDAKAADSAVLRKYKRYLTHMARRARLYRDFVEIDFSERPEERCRATMESMFNESYICYERWTNENEPTLGRRTNENDSEFEDVNCKGKLLETASSIWGEIDPVHFGCGPSAPNGFRCHPLGATKKCRRKKQAEHSAAWMYFEESRWDRVLDALTLSPFTDYTSRLNDFRRRMAQDEEAGGT